MCHFALQHFLRDFYFGLFPSFEGIGIYLPSGDIGTICIHNSNGRDIADLVFSS